MSVTQATVIRSEWIKLRTVRSTVIAIAASAVVAVGFGAIFASSAEEPRRAVGRSSVSLSLAGFNLSQLVIGVVGVVLVSSEYSSGLIRTTLAAVRSRTSVLRAKAVVYAAVIAVVATAAAFAAYFVGQAVTSTATMSLGDAGVLRSVLGTAVYCVGVGLLGVALGFLLRSTAAAIGVLFATLLLIPGLASLLPWSWADTATKYLPSNAGDAFKSFSSTDSLLSPTTGAVVFALWVVGLLAAAGVALRQRDA